MRKEKYKAIVTAGCLFSLILTGCSKFDKSRIPLYDEVMVPPAEPENDPRRTPVKNPMTMPPGYRKPSFNEYPNSENTRVKGLLQQEAETALSPSQNEGEIKYPELASVPKRPNDFTSPDAMQQSYENLEAEKDRALMIQQAIKEGKEVPASMLAESRPAELPAEGEKTATASMPWAETAEPARIPGVDYDPEHPDGLKQHIKPITFADENSEEKPSDSAPAEVASVPAETHEFGTPQMVEGGHQSSTTQMYDVGYKSEEDKLRDEELFRLKQFEYRNVPRINEPKLKPTPQVTFNDVQDPPKFLPESRYKARRIDGPYYTHTYHGATYFKNQY